MPALVSSKDPLVSKSCTGCGKKQQKQTKTRKTKHQQNKTTNKKHTNQNKQPDKTHPSAGSKGEAVRRCALSQHSVVLRPEFHHCSSLQQRSIRSIVSSSVIRNSRRSSTNQYDQIMSPVHLVHPVGSSCGRPLV